MLRGGPGRHHIILDVSFESAGCESAGGCLRFNSTPDEGDPHRVIVPGRLGLRSRFLKSPPSSPPSLSCPRPQKRLRSARERQKRYLSIQVILQLSLHPYDRHELTLAAPLRPPLRAPARAPTAQRERSASRGAARRGQTARDRRADSSDGAALRGRCARVRARAGAGARQVSGLVPVVGNNEGV